MHALPFCRRSELLDALTVQAPHDAGHYFTVLCHSAAVSDPVSAPSVVLCPSAGVSGPRPVQGQRGRLRIWTKSSARERYASLPTLPLSPGPEGLCLNRNKFRHGRTPCSQILLSSSHASPQGWREAEREALEELRSTPGAPEALGLSGSELLPSEGAQGQGQGQGQRKGQGRRERTRTRAAGRGPPRRRSTPAVGSRRGGQPRACSGTGDSDSPPTAAQDGPQGQAGPQEGGDTGRRTSGAPQAGQGADPVVAAYQERGIQTQGAGAGAPQAYQEDAEGGRRGRPPPPARQGGRPGGGGGTPGVRPHGVGTGRSWRRVSPLREDASADVVAVGAGITGGCPSRTSSRATGWTSSCWRARVVGGCSCSCSFIPSLCRSVL